jgi:hypothetical protein
MTSLRLPTVALIAVLAGGCAIDPALRSDCDWATPIRPSKDDVLTRKTKEMILAHNEVVRRECGGRR